MVEVITSLISQDKVINLRILDDKESGKLLLNSIFLQAAATLLSKQNKKMYLAFCGHFSKPKPASIPWRLRSHFSTRIRPEGSQLRP